MLRTRVKADHEAHPQQGHRLQGLFHLDMRTARRPYARTACTPACSHTCMPACKYMHVRKHTAMHVASTIPRINRVPGVVLRRCGLSVVQDYLEGSTREVPTREGHFGAHPHAEVHAQDRVARWRAASTSRCVTHSHVAPHVACCITRCILHHACITVRTLHSSYMLHRLLKCLGILRHHQSLEARRRSGAVPTSRPRSSLPPPLCRRQRPRA